ncbi:MAG: hypothetical protein GY868_13545, partial [Deltaproteobacteria bacterium]|nr:hypothetical protein [Deltaproteobacteria bacterium]
MSIHIGNQTSFAAPSIDVPFRFAIDNGFSAFEWFPDKKDDGSGWEIDDISTDQRDSYRNSAFKNNLRISVHVPWNANPLQPDAGRIISEHICFAKDMGASLINIHLYTD